LTKKEEFHYTRATFRAFEELKKVLTKSPLLALINLSQPLPFEIECDAYGKGIRATLMQNKRPIAYFSKALSPKFLSKFA